MSESNRGFEQLNPLIDAFCHDLCGDIATMVEVISPIFGLIITLGTGYWLRADIRKFYRILLRDRPDNFAFVCEEERHQFSEIRRIMGHTSQYLSFLTAEIGKVCGIVLAILLTQFVLLLGAFSAFVVQSPLIIFGLVLCRNLYALSSQMADIDAAAFVTAGELQKRFRKSCDYMGCSSKEIGEYILGHREDLIINATRS